jgi:hypothetical protein
MAQARIVEIAAASRSIQVQRARVAKQLRKA